MTQGASPARAAPGTGISGMRVDRRSAPLAFGSRLVVAVASLAGLAAFAYPFAFSAVIGLASAGGPARSVEAPVVLAALTGACLVAVLAELGSGGRAGPAAAAKTVALLGVLVATDAVLRLLPTVLGASPIFLLILLVGAAFGPSFGFLMGALTLLLSAFLTGGLGPWLPYQMLSAGWVGLTAGWLPRGNNHRARLLLLALLGAAWGLLFGALMNLYAWPFTAPGLEADVGLYWTPGLNVVETLDRYGRFYLATSLLYDLFRAIANAALVLLLGGPTLRVLDRFRTRFAWEPWIDLPPNGWRPRDDSRLPGRR